jgi:hypothetical protein
MDLQALLKSLEMSGLASAIRNSLYWFPLLESVHVMALAVLFGTIAVVDLRILGLASRGRSFHQVASDAIKWTWIGFVVVAITGALMFITNARVYADNGFFRAKLILLALAGMNMCYFEFTAGRQSHRWDAEPSGPLGAKVAATLSLLLWISVIAMGRAVGFTTTGAQAKEQPAAAAGVDFDSFLGGDSTGDNATANTTGGNATGADTAAPPAAAPAK